jgi:hypothetical protein
MNYKSLIIVNIFFTYSDIFFVSLNQLIKTRIYVIDFVGELWKKRFV